MTECNHEQFAFSNCRKRKVRWNFFGGSISSNAGALLLREVDRRLGLCARVARRLGDLRQREKVRHEVETMVRQRMLAVALGHEGLNDHDALRHDLVVQTACGRHGRGRRRARCRNTCCRSHGPCATLRWRCRTSKLGYRRLASPKPPRRIGLDHRVASHGQPWIELSVKRRPALTPWRGARFVGVIHRALGWRIGIKKCNTVDAVWMLNSRRPAHFDRGEP